MTDAQRLALVRAIHTAIYVVMAVSTFVLLYAGITGSRGVWLWVVLVLLGIEVVVFAGSGMKCPLYGKIDGSLSNPSSLIRRVNPD